MDELTRARYEEWKRNRIRKRVIIPGIGALCVLISLILVVVFRIINVEGIEESSIEESTVLKSIIKVEYEHEYVLIEDHPIVYLFNSHPHEMIGSTYDNQFVGDMSIVELTHILANFLEFHGIATLIEDRCVDARLRENNWEFYMSYYAARYYLVDAMQRYPNMEFFVDLHRDGIPHEYATVEINGANYARILFVIGTDNPYYEASREVARQLDEMLEERKPGISRSIFYSGDSPGRDGVYSQDLSPMVQLIEIGTITSTVEEVSRSVEILAEVLAEYILSLNGE